MMKFLEVLYLFLLIGCSDLFVAGGGDSGDESNENQYSDTLIVLADSLYVNTKYSKNDTLLMSVLKTREQRSLGIDFVFNNTTNLKPLAIQSKSISSGAMEISIEKNKDIVFENDSLDGFWIHGFEVELEMVEAENVRFAPIFENAIDGNFLFVLSYETENDAFTLEFDLSIKEYQEVEIRDSIDGKSFIWRKFNVYVGDELEMSIKSDIELSRYLMSGDQFDEFLRKGVLPESPILALKTDSKDSTLTIDVTQQWVYLVENSNFVTHEINDALHLSSNLSP